MSPMLSVPNRTIYHVDIYLSVHQSFLMLFAVSSYCLVCMHCNIFQMVGECANPLLMDSWVIYTLLQL